MHHRVDSDVKCNGLNTFAHDDGMDCSVKGVRRGKAAFFQWVQVPPGERSRRKQPEQSWR